MYSQFCDCKRSLIHHLFMDTEQPQRAPYSSGLIRFKHICVCSHWLSLPTATAHSYAQTEASLMHTHVSVRTHTHILLSHSFSSFHFSLHPSLVASHSLSTVLHANELSVLMPEHYRCVCLISLLPFLFPGDYPVFRRNRPSTLHSAPLPTNLPASRSVSQAGSQQACQRPSVSSRYHYHLNVPSNMTVEQQLRKPVCACMNL